MNSSNISKTVTHTHETPDGTVIVVREVPARLFIDENGSEHHRYSLKVAQKLEKIIDSAIVSNKKEKNLVLVNFNEDIQIPDVDMELRVRGQGIIYGEATIGVWKKTFDRIYTALNTLQKTLADLYGIKNITGFPVGYASEGSLRIGIRKNDSNQLFQNEFDINSQTIDIIMQLSNFIDRNEKKLPSILEHNPKLYDAALKAIEELSPTSRDEITSVEVSNKKLLNNQKVAVLTARTREKALRARVESNLLDGTGQLQTLKGIIYQININGTIRIKYISDALPLIKSKTIVAYVNENILSETLEVMKNKRKVMLNGIVRTPKKGQHKYEIIEITPIDRDFN